MVSEGLVNDHPVAVDHVAGFADPDSADLMAVCLEAGNFGHKAVVVRENEGCFQVAADDPWLCGYVMGNEWSKTRITRND